MWECPICLDDTPIIAALNQPTDASDTMPGMLMITDLSHPRVD